MSDVDNLITTLSFGEINPGKEKRDMNKKTNFINAMTKPKEAPSTNDPTARMNAERAMAMRSASSTGRASTVLSSGKGSKLG